MPEPLSFEELTRLAEGGHTPQEAEGWAAAEELATIRGRALAAERDAALSRATATEERCVELEDRCQGIAEALELATNSHRCPAEGLVAQARTILEEGQ